MSVLPSESDLNTGTPCRELSPSVSIDDAFDEVYPQLRSLAASWWFREPVDHTLTPTALVHEAYVSLKRSSPDTDRGKAYFYASAAQAMRRVLIDHARRRSRKPWVCRVSVESLGSGARQEVSVLELDEALRSLAAVHPRSARVAEYRLFAGMPPSLIVTILGVSERTVSLDWRFARSHIRSTLMG